MRLLLFFATNAAVLVVISVVFRLLGFEGLLARNGVDLDLNALLVYSAIIGFSGSLISLFMSKFMAKHSMGVQLIEQPGNEAERWLLDTVSRQAQAAGIGMPEALQRRHIPGPAKCLRHRLEPERRAGGGQQRAAAGHEPG